MGFEIERTIGGGMRIMVARELIVCRRNTVIRIERRDYW
jgi:hypothetical protein